MASISSAVTSGQHGRPARSEQKYSDRRLPLAGFAVGLSAVLIAGGVWLAGASTPSWPNALSTLLRERRGQQVYDANCVSCHAGPAGGAIDDYPPRHNANGHTWHHPDCFITRVTRDGISQPSALAPPDAPTMPAFRDRLSPDDIDAVLAYIKTLWTPEQRIAQASFTREMCF